MRNFFHSLTFGLIVVLLSFLARQVLADEVGVQTVPGKWLSDLLPEDMPEPAYADYDQNDPLERARTQLNAGQYRRALVTLQAVPASKAKSVALVAGEADLELGRYDRALATLTAPDANTQVLRANVLARQGNFADAIVTLRKVIDAHPDLIAPRYFLGEYLERSGDIDDAKSAFAWFVTEPHNFLQEWAGHPETFNNARDVTLIGRAIDHWATLTMSYQSQRGLHDLVLDMFVKAYDVIDRDYWPAHVAAAEYLHRHDDDTTAAQELNIALGANPANTSAWELVAKIQLAQFNFDGVDRAIQQIRSVQSDSFDADLLQARNLLGQRLPKSALPLLNRAIEREPNNIEALGLLASAYALLLQDDKARQILKAADSANPNSAEAYFEMAEQLGAMRQYPRAAAMYQIAIDRAPWWTAARNGLGLLHTQSGDEASARVVLEAAHSLDPFNVRTTNYLRLLDMMDHFARSETAHFIVMYDADQDPVIPEYFGEYLETVYPQVCGAFKFEPAVKTMIEVFPTHDAFSVRTSGAPWIATVGASTGRVIALVAPRAGAGTMGTFNFSQVLRHEFTHTVTLGATDNRIAHWFTEGLAVQEEHSPVRWEWVPMLYRAVSQGELFDLDQLTWAFVRPRRPIDRSLAYAESSWVCQFIEEKYGHDAILRMLDQFRAGKTQDEVFQIALNETESAFFAEFMQWCQGQIAQWGYDPATSAKYELLRNDGEQLIRDGQYLKAVAVFEEIVRLRPMDVLPHQRLAGLYMNTEVGQPQKAAEQLDILARVEINNNMFAKGAARIYRDINQLDLAQARALQAVYIAPYDRQAHILLAEIADKKGDTAVADRERRVIKLLTPPN